MPTVYRIEQASTGRAQCQNTECKRDKVKIAKGELRHGTLVEVYEHQSFRWKHWGCVTPVNLATWKDITGGDPDMIDGLDELPEELQQTVLRAIDQGHVDDSVWKGDVEKNRPGAKGFRLTKAERKAMGLLDSDDEEPKDAVKPSKSKKRQSRDEQSDADGVSAPAAKKSKKSASKATENGDEANKNAKAKRTKSKAKDDSGSEALDEEKSTSKSKPGPEKPAKKEPKSKTKAAPVTSETVSGDTTDEKPKAKRGRPSKKAQPEPELSDSEAEMPKPKAKRGRPKKA